jgi:hypothetical protein
LRENQSNSEKEHIIKKAATSGQATFTTAIFGRGTDFICNDTKLLAAGGVHIVQTFVASDMCEEKQIQGRTARQGKDGTYSMVLLGKELEAVGLDPKAAMRMRPPELYDKIKDVIRKQCRDVSQRRDEQLKSATERDKMSHDYFAALLNANRPLAKTKFTDLYDVCFKGLKKLNRNGKSGPTAGARVHFSGCLLSDVYSPGWTREINKPDDAGEYVGAGDYTENMKAFPNSIRHTFDSVAVDAGTRVTIYSKPHFQGEVLWDVVGPAVIVNELFKGSSEYGDLCRPWKEPLNTIFPPEVREWSCTNMHLWNTGSLRIEDGEPIPAALKEALPEYGALDNDTY